MKRKILVLLPHPDDAEFSCGGTLAKFTENGDEVHYIVFSNCSKSLPDELPENILYDELDQAAIRLGVELNNITKYNYPVREFPRFRQEILENLVLYKNSFHPDLVLLPNKNDVHQDHNTIYNEGVRAFKTCSVLGYELPWNNVTKSETNYFIRISEKQLNQKLEAISRYKSQSFRNYMDLELFRSLAKLRGKQVGAEYAEAFELVRWID